MPQANKSNAVDLVTGVLQRRKWLGIIAFLAVVSVGVPFAMFLPNLYRGSATLLVDTEAGSTFVKPTVSELDTRLVTVQQEILSRTRLADLIRRLNLYPALRTRETMDALVERLRKDIRMEMTSTDQSRGTPTTIAVKISYVGLDARTAAAVPNALAAQYVEENSNIRARQSGQMADFLSTQLAQAQREMNLRQERVNAFKQSRAGLLPEQTGANLAAAERVTARLAVNADLQMRARERRDRLAEQMSTAPAPSTGASSDPAERLSTLRARLRELQRNYTDRHPEVIATAAEIRELEGQVASAEKAGASPGRSLRQRQADALREVEAEMEALVREERLLRTQAAGYEERLRVAPSHEQELAALMRDLETAKASYSSLQSRHEEAQLARSLESTRKGDSFRILDPAVIPTIPAAPNRLRLLLLVLFSAFAAAAAAMVLRDQMDTSFHSLGELRQFTTVPVFTAIPDLGSDMSIARRSMRILAAAVGVGILCALLSAAAYGVARENASLVRMVAGAAL